MSRRSGSLGPTPACERAVIGTLWVLETEIRPQCESIGKRHGERRSFCAELLLCGGELLLRGINLLLPGMELLLRGVALLLPLMEPLLRVMTKVG